MTGIICIRQKLDLTRFWMCLIAPLSVSAILPACRLTLLHPDKLMASFGVSCYPPVGTATRWNTIQTQVHTIILLRPNVYLHLAKTGVRVCPTTVITPLPANAMTGSLVTSAKKQSRARP